MTFINGSVSQSSAAFSRTASVGKRRSVGEGGKMETKGEKRGRNVEKRETEKLFLSGSLCRTAQRAKAAVGGGTKERPEEKERDRVKMRVC